MELISGICGICDSGNEIISPKDSGTFWETICEIFENELDNLRVLQPQLKVCSACVFHANLINTRKKIWKGISNVSSTGTNKCRICEENVSLLKIENSVILKTSESSQNSRTKGWSIVCSYCYYVLKASFNLKTKLTNKLSECITSPSTLKGVSHSNQPEESCFSDYEANTISESRKNLLECKKEVMSNSEISDENTEGSEDVQTLNEELSQKLRRGRSKRKKLKNKEPVEETEYRGRNTRKRKSSTSPNKNFAPKLKKRYVESTEINGLDMSKVLCLLPLCKTNITANKAIKQDAKFYYSIPFVKVPIINECDKNHSVESMKNSPSATPVSTKKRTPPIKIKLKKLTKLERGVYKKYIRKDATQDEKKSTSMNHKFKGKEVVVKVERMTIPTDNLESENSVAAYESALKNSSTEDITPKKKKKVHFNDTPTFIVTGSELSEDSTNDEEDLKRKNSRNGKVIKHEEEEKLEEKYSIEINSDESDDEPEEETEKYIVDDNEEKSNSEKTKSLNREDTEIDVSDAESDQLITSHGQLEKQGDGDSSSKQADNESVELEKADNETVELKNLEKPEEDLNEQNVVLEVDKEQEKLCQKDSLADEDINEVVEKSVVETHEKCMVKEQNNPTQAEITLIQDSDENSVDEIGFVQLTDECSDEEAQEILNNEIGSKSKTENTGEFSENGNNVEQKQDNELDADEIVVNDIVLTEATTLSEEFGSLIDEVQECLTSKEISSDIPEMQESSSELAKDDPLSCLNDIDKDLGNTFTDNLIDDEKTSNMDVDTSSVDNTEKKQPVEDTVC